MTVRKPGNMSVPEWIEAQIQQAQREGRFDDLPGAGKPIPGLDAPQDALSWVAAYLRREDADVTTVLPPALAIAKEVERLPDRLVTERSETRVREIVTELNERIDAEHAKPQDGVPFRVKRVRVEDTVAQWREHRAALQAVAATAPDTTTPPLRAPSGRDSDPGSRPHRARRRWFQRSRRSVSGSDSPAK